MPSYKKNRRYPRVNLPKGTLVAWEYTGKRQISYANVAGLGGLFIATLQPPEAGVVIKLVLDIPGGEVRARAIVVDSRPGRGMGIQFTSMAQEARGRLNQFLKNLAKPEPVAVR